MRLARKAFVFGGPNIPERWAVGSDLKHLEALLILVTSLQRRLCSRTRRSKLSNRSLGQPCSKRQWLSLRSCGSSMVLALSVGVPRQAKQPSPPARAPPAGFASQDLPVDCPDRLLEIYRAFSLNLVSIVCSLQCLHRALQAKAYSSFCSKLCSPVCLCVCVCVCAMRTITYGLCSLL